MNSKCVAWVSTASRVVAWFAGANPEDVWTTYGQFEHDSSVLFQTAEDIYNEVKWLLEERERRRERLDVVAVTSDSSLDDKGPK